MAKITKKFLSALKPGKSDRFERDDSLTGFGVKVTPSGRISFIVEGRIRGGRTRRITLGQYPALSIEDAKEQAREHLQLMQKGEDPTLKKKQEAAKKEALGKTVEAVFEEYMSARDLKPKTVQDYRNTFNLIFKDWKKRPIREISRKDVEEKFVSTRDTRGQATAAKANRIISAVFNFAMADEVQGERLITENPADVIKQKRYKTTVRRREGYLDQYDIYRIIDYYHVAKNWPETPAHGVTDQGIHYVMLLLCSGLRKSEALRLRWDAIDWASKHFVVRNTKNGRDHYVPLSIMLAEVLRRQREYLKKIKKADSPWVFPARYGDGHMTEPKSQLKKICNFIGIDFSLHDLRRTFATHAEANGVPYELIKKALNHKSKSVTQGYIITQIDTLRPVFDAVATGYLRCYLPDHESEMAIEEELANMSEEEVAEVLEDHEPAKFPYRGETEIVESKLYSKKGTT